MKTNNLVAFLASLTGSQKRSSRRAWALIGIVLLTLCFSDSAGLAATTVWSGSSSGGDFNTDSNWTSLAPGHTSASDLGIFNSSTNVNGTITFSADITHFRTFVQDTSGTISFDTGPYKWTMTSFFLTGTGAGEVNTIREIGGTIQSDFILLGNDPGSSNNSIEVTGAGTLWNNTNTGAAVRIGSGGSNNSTFTIHNGGKVTTSGQTTLGLVGSSNGRLYVTDTGVLVTANYLGVGHSAGAANATNNEVDILNGGTVTASHTLMGITTGATDNKTLVSGSGSTLTLTGVGTQSQIGMAGVNNTLQIDNGGSVLGGSKFRLGVGAASTGNQLIINDGTLAGTGIEAIRGDVAITNSNVDLSDFFSVPDSAYIEGTLAATGAGTSSISFNSGTVKTVNSNIANGSQFAVGDGGANAATFIMKKTGSNDNGTHTFANGLFLNSNAVLMGSGNIVGNVSGAAGAQVNVGSSPGLINVAGNWDNTGMTVGLEIGDLSASTLPGVGYDLLDINGAFTHGGSLVIDTSGYVPGPIGELKLVGWTSDVGSTANTAVSFIGGAPMNYQFRSDGFYVTNIPEPSTLAFGLLALGICLGRRSTKR
ncbi:MAG TPA: PEP-CTERM sorting domain-containing protein [Lacipirellulaceae bacterium]|nr:PEP-CTERM sorting domain-containing protein [Lacipirellulaceae bacterium]